MIAIKEAPQCAAPNVKSRYEAQGVLPLIDAVNYSIALKASFKGSSEIKPSASTHSSPACTAGANY